MSLESLFLASRAFSFIYLDKLNSTIYFGRDKYGQRSLLIGNCGNNFIITSVAKQNTDYKFIEIPPVGIFSISFNKRKQFRVKPWFENNHIKSKINELNIFLNIKIQIDTPILSSSSFKEFIPPSETDLSHHYILKTSCSSYVFTEIPFSCNIANNLQELKHHLENAIRSKISTAVKFCKDCVEEQIRCKHSSVGVLFSGGVDCAILAHMANTFIEKDKSIDLLNVAFSKNDFDTPDRTSGLQTFGELKLLFPDRKWNFVRINVSFEELHNERKNRIADLIYPLHTEFDDGLGCTLWFASRGISGDYISPCRILLAGMGADELFGGHTSYRSAFKDDGWLGLHNILRKDWENLPYRNHGRDDRVASDHGRQLINPYLDEDLVKFAQNLNYWERTFPSDDVPQEIGNKFLLRALAFNLGLSKAAVLKKRASDLILLAGMGADELFGGHTSYRSAFKDDGWLGLHNILRKDWENLPYRNHGRDERVASDHGRQLINPYLDEDLVKFAQNLNYWERTFPSDNVPQEIGNEFLLRALAFNLGLSKVAVLKKRASDLVIE